MAKKTDELQLLEQEIGRLKKRSRELEAQLDEKLDYLQDNFRTLAIKSVLPSFLARAGATGTILEVFMENKQFRNSVNKLTDTLFDKISAGVEFLGKKFSKKPT
ncbi:MAG: hypothetical protein ACHQEM_00920 [Chitinophagales bacterium]